MNRVNWVDGRYTTPADFNAMQTAPEDHLRSHAKAALAGFIDGLTVTGTAGGVQVGPGVTWDSQGRRIMVPAAVSPDVSKLVRPASGRFKWVVVYASYQRVERDTVRDSAGINQPAYLDDGYTLTVAAGPEFAAASIEAARDTDAGKPAVPSESVGIALFVVDHDSAWPELAASPRRYTLFQSRLAVVYAGTLSQARDAISPLVPMPSDVVYGSGALTVTFAGGKAAHSMKGVQVIRVWRPPLLHRDVAVAVPRPNQQGSPYITVGATTLASGAAEFNISLDDAGVTGFSLLATFLL